MLVVLHSGPVGFSDAIGQTNASLIRRTCNANGTLLKPSKPLTTIDRLVLLGEDSQDAPKVVASYDGKSYAVSSALLLLLLCLIAIDSWVPACLRACVPACLRACVPACLRACVRACLPACLPVCLHIQISLRVHMYIFAMVWPCLRV